MTLLCICGFSWSTFWTALTAVGTIAMAIITYYTLCKNDNQVAEMKRQWEEDHRPYLNIKLVMSNANFTTDSRTLYIENYGKGVANEVQFVFDNDLIENIPNVELKTYMRELQKEKYRILPNNNLSVPFCNILDYHKNTYRINTQEFDFNKKNELIEYFNKTIAIMLKYRWNGKVFEDGPFLLDYNKV